MSRLRALAVPRRVRVEEDEHDDPRVVWSGRRPRPVEAVRERWRIDDEWWREPVSREYRTVALEDGGLETLYRDRVNGGWYLHG